MAACLASILVTLHVLIGGVMASGCDGVHYKTSTQSEASCVRNNTCYFQAPRGRIFQDCRILYGHECRRYAHQGETNSPNDVTASLVQSPTAVLSRLGVQPVSIHTESGDVTVYNLYLWIGMDHQDVDSRVVSGILMQFQSREDNHNCQYKAIPVCRYFDLSQGNNNNTTSTSSSSRGTGDGAVSSRRGDASPAATQKPETTREKVYIPYACFGFDVLPGSFSIRLTSFPGSGRSLTYRVTWHQPDYPDHYDYNYDYVQDDRPWPFHVVGVACEPGTNQIDVVIQRPLEGEGQGIVRLELRDAWETEGNGVVVDSVQLDPDESSTMFSHVPKGLYRVVVSIQGHSCQFDHSCPPFVSDVIYVDSQLDSPQAGDTVSMLEHPDNYHDYNYTLIAVLLLLGVFCVGGLAVLRWRRTVSKASVHAPSVLLISLERGRLREQTVKYLAASIHDLLTFQVHTLHQANTLHTIHQSNTLHTQASRHTSGDGPGQPLTHHVDSLTRWLLLLHTHTIPKSDSVKRKMIQQKLKPYNAVALVGFLCHTDAPGHGSLDSPCGQSIGDRSGYTKDDVVDLIQAWADDKSYRKRIHPEVGLVYFTESPPPPPRRISTILSLSRDNDRIVDPCSTVTGSIPDGVGDRRWEKGEDGETVPSTASLKCFRLGNQSNDNNEKYNNSYNSINYYSNNNQRKNNYSNNNISVYEYSNNNIDYGDDMSGNNYNTNNTSQLSSSKHFSHRTFHLPTEVVTLFDWLHSTCHHLQPPPPPPSSHLISQCPPWQAAITCCRKSFIDIKHALPQPPPPLRCHSDHHSDCFTVITEDTPAGDCKQNNEYRPLNPRDASGCSHGDGWMSHNRDWDSLYWFPHHDLISRNGGVESERNSSLLDDEMVPNNGNDIDGDCWTIETEQDVGHVTGCPSISDVSVHVYR